MEIGDNYRYNVNTIIGIVRRTDENHKKTCSY